MSHTKNDKLWDALKSLLNEWRHRRPVILQWNAMCLGLTARAVRLLYGPSVGADTIHFMLCVPSQGILVTHAVSVRRCPRRSSSCLMIILSTPGRAYSVRPAALWLSPRTAADSVDLLGDLELIPTGPNYADTMKGIQALTNYLISVKLPTGALMAGVRVSCESLAFVISSIV